jgi:hypothetical protein
MRPRAPEPLMMTRTLPLSNAFEIVPYHYDIADKEQNLEESNHIDYEAVLICFEPEFRRN